MPASAASLVPREESIAGRLLEHYARTARALPWRSPPGTASPDPYRVWLSEVMLQQTTAAAVAPRFTRFVERWPTVEALAAASDEAVLGEWAGLGYYARARNLIACARTVAARGGFPDTEAGLRALPGVGVYTAAAIAAIAFGRDSSPIDTNVERIVSRLEALTDKSAIRAAAQAMTPTGRAGDFAQALMDLGATICRPRRPLCPQCPMESLCVARSLGRPTDFPSPKARTTRPHRHGLAYWHRRGDEILLVRRPAEGMLGGMAALPGPDWNLDGPPASALATVRHGFTHFTLDLHIVDGSPDEVSGSWWQPLSKIAEAGLPTLYRSAVTKVLKVHAAKGCAIAPAMLESGHLRP